MNNMYILRRAYNYMLLGKYSIEWHTFVVAFVERAKGALQRILRATAIAGSVFTRSGTAVRHCNSK
jgi:hypothetical protein